MTPTPLSPVAIRVDKIRCQTEASGGHSTSISQLSSHVIRTLTSRMCFAIICRLWQYWLAVVCKREAGDMALQTCCVVLTVTVAAAIAAPSGGKFAVAKLGNVDNYVIRVP